MIIIGEKLNGSIPTVAKAIAEHDADFIKERAKQQADCGAAFLDVCASVEEEIEAETLKWMIDLVQEVTDVPICVDSPSANTCIRALPFCKRPGLVNSVSLEGDKIDTIFPVIADTEWECVALLCDKDGIPTTVEKRMEVFHGIMDKAKQYGITPDRLHIDPLVVTLSTDQTALLVFSECCRQIKAEYPEIHITSGLSNISYGLPMRKNVNYAFMALAMLSGMDSAIVDPTDQQMMGIVYATEALLNQDEFCLNYIRHTIGQKQNALKSMIGAETLAEEKLKKVSFAVENGDRSHVGQYIKEALEAGCPPLDILNTGMIGAMDIVGDNFKKQVIFVPQMLSAARAMKTGVDVLKPYLAEGTSGSIGTMILGTVAGDFHDIGKNLVGMMIESAGIDVIDLGVDVPIETFIREIENHPEVTVVGLSALLTTTMPSLRDTVAALNRASFRKRIRIMVGGAPISQQFSDEIGADVYTPDAAAAAKKAKELMLTYGGMTASEYRIQSVPAADIALRAGSTEKTSAKKAIFDDTRLKEILAKPVPPCDLSMSRYKKNWDKVQEKWRGYWKQSNTGRPLMCLIARKPEIEQYSDGTPVEGGYLDQICQGKYYNMPEELKWTSMEDKYQNAQRIVNRYHYFCQTHEFLGESFPNLNIDFGPGSLAAYLGSDIGFKEDTVWFLPCLNSWEESPCYRFDPENEWFLRHLELARECRRLSGNDFYVDMPDLMENIDVLASLRGAQDVLYDLIDEPEIIRKKIQEVTDLYFDYYDKFYDAICDEEGGNAYTVFQIWGPGRTVKLQCDFSAMMDPKDFRAYIKPSLEQQTEKVDHVLYHLDGPDAIKHLDALMEIRGIDALQWTSGDAGPDGTLPDWDVIYDKAILAGKSIWVKVYSGAFEDWIKNVDRLVHKYGSHSLFLLFPEMSLQQAEKLLDYAEEHWSDIRGTFCEENNLK